MSLNRNLTLRPTGPARKAAQVRLAPRYAAR